MSKKIKRLISVALIVALVFSSNIISLAADILIAPNPTTAKAAFEDVGGWSEEAVNAALSNGLVNGYEDGTFRPKGNLTRAEFAAIITRAFGATALTSAGFADLNPNEWYYIFIQKAVKMGVLQGGDNNTMRPNDPITREEVFTAVARALVLTKATDSSVLNKFKDSDKLSAWAKDAVAALVELGYVNGDNEGYLNPKGYITREEFCQFMHNIIKTYIDAPGYYYSVKNGGVMIRSSGVTLSGVNINGDLILGDGVGTGNISVLGTSVSGRILCRGGSGGITLDKVTLGKHIVVNNPNGNVHFNLLSSDPLFKNLLSNTNVTFKNSTGGGGAGGGGGYIPTPTTSWYLSLYAKSDYLSAPNNSILLANSVKIEDNTLLVEAINSLLTKNEQTVINSMETALFDRLAAKQISGREGIDGKPYTIINNKTDRHVKLIKTASGNINPVTLASNKASDIIEEFKANTRLNNAYKIAEVKALVDYLANVNNFVKPVAASESGYALLTSQEYYNIMLQIGSLTKAAMDKLDYHYEKTIINQMINDAVDIVAPKIKKALDLLGKTYDLSTIKDNILQYVDIFTPKKTVNSLNFTSVDSNTQEVVLIDNSYITVKLIKENK